MGYVTDFLDVLSEEKTSKIKSYFVTVPKERRTLAYADYGIGLWVKNGRRRNE